MSATNGRRVVVMGGGIAGLSAALLLARGGLRVTLLERDQAPPRDLADMWHWNRPGAPQMRQLHTFLGLFRKELRARLSDVYEDLLAHGVEAISVATPSGTGGGDPDLAVLAARRPVVEWALHRALVREAGVELRYGTSVRRADVAGGRIRGVHVRGGLLEADVLIDAAGRRSPLREDFTRLEQEVECGVVYNTRFFRLREGVARPALQRGVTSMVAGVGFGAGLFYHDNRTFAIGLARLPDDDSLKALRDTESFDRAAGLFPEFAPWLAGEVSEPVTEVVPMAGLRNCLRSLTEQAPAGYFVLGDALCTTDPAFGRGASVALHGAARLADAFAQAPDDLPGLAPEVTAQALSWVRPLFDDSVQADIARTRLWEAALSGAPVPAAPGVPSVNPFLLVEAGERDPVLWQAAQRCVNLLEPLESLDVPEIRQRLQAVWASGWRPAAPAAPSHAEVAGAVALGRRVFQNQ
ncbi:NAD(P)/FAD-dependent oxidoreductase [Streptomyces sp. NPDC056730]|uniref:NAD(P)/FAD-dependent oxidoreductase n=1 Tax=Streptomyces sp. NPDC056730 TaxID=3345929 RepID=UPI0036B79742